MAADDFFRNEAINSTEELQLAREWASEGLINNLSGLAGVSAALTHRGIEHVNALRQKRADPALRRSAAVDGLLRWLYEVDPDGEGWANVDDFRGRDGWGPRCSPTARPAGTNKGPTSCGWTVAFLTSTMDGRSG